MPTSCRIVTQANLFHPAGCCELLGGHWAPGGSDMSRVIQLLGGRSHSVWSELRAHAVLTWLYSAGFSAAFPKAIQRSSFWVWGKVLTESTHNITFLKPQNAQPHTSSSDPPGLKSAQIAVIDNQGSRDKSQLCLCQLWHPGHVTFPLRGLVSFSIKWSNNWTCSMERVSKLSELNTYSPHSCVRAVWHLEAGAWEFVMLISMLWIYVWKYSQC